MTEIDYDTYELQPLFNEPIKSPYWDRTGMMGSTKVLGHALNEFEQRYMLKNYGPNVIVCGPPSWQMDWDNMVLWKYWIK